MRSSRPPGQPARRCYRSAGIAAGLAVVRRWHHLHAVQQPGVPALRPINNPDRYAVRQPQPRSRSECQGAVYVADQNSTTSGGWRRIKTRPCCVPGLLATPMGVAVDNSGNTSVSPANSNRVVKLKASRITRSCCHSRISPLRGASGWTKPEPVVTEHSTNQVVKLHKPGRPPRRCYRSPSTPPSLVESGQRPDRLRRRPRQRPSGELTS